MVQFIKGNKRLPIVIAAALAWVINDGQQHYITPTGEVVNVQPAN